MWVVRPKVTVCTEPFLPENEENVDRCDDETDEHDEETDDEHDNITDKCGDPV